MSLTLHSDYNKFMEMPLPTLIQTVETAQKVVKRLGKRKKR